MSKLGQQLREVREKKGLSQRQVSLATGIEQSMISNIERGQSLLVSPHLEKLADYFGIDVLNPLGANLEPIVLEGTVVPVWPQSQASRLFWAEPAEQEKEAIRHQMTAKRYDRKTFAVSVEDESMVPRFHRGDIAVIDPGTKPAIGSIIAVSRGGGSAALLGQYADRGKTEEGAPRFEIIPVNQLYPTLRSETEGLVLLGVVVEKVEILVPGHSW